jgi:prepilin-type N-terminal cleavage/methylation domain-containing protein
LSRQGAWNDERGFTLFEVMATIVVMGIVFAIASSTWFGVVESRRVDSATNQVVADLRLAHSRATNRLEDWRVEMDANTRNYRTYRKDPLTGNFTLVSSNSLPERTEFLPTMSVPTAIVFDSAGGAQITGAGGIKTAADDGSPCRVIEVNSVTSRTKVSTSAC